jgi:mono/diheme cytochrome c family protein
MATTTMVRALAMAALSLLAACGSRGADQADTIGADIAASRPAGASAEPPLVSPPSGALAPAPQAVAPPDAAPPETSIAGTQPGSGGIGLGGAGGPGDPRLGRRFALDNCRPCHVVAADQASPIRFANAPDFRRIAQEPRTSPFTLNVWLTNPHPTMPTLQLTPDEAANVIAYILSLRG